MVVVLVEQVETSVASVRLLMPLAMFLLSLRVL